jgi:YesN/AraC family two-component response regulator
VNRANNEPTGEEGKISVREADTGFLDRRLSPEGLAASAGDSSEDSLRVLIVEDSSIVRGRIIRLVSGVEGVKVVGMAVDGTHALALFRELKPDVMLLDIQLPGLNGIELLTRVRSEQAACKVIVLTTYAFDEFRRKCLDLHAEFFFDKALEFPRVVEVLGRMARKRSANSQ